MMPAGTEMRIDPEGNPYYFGGCFEIVRAPDGRWVCRTILQFARRDGAGVVRFSTRPLAGIVGIADTPDAAYLAMRDYQFAARNPDAKPGDWARWQREIQKEKTP